MKKRIIVLTLAAVAALHNLFAQNQFQTEYLIGTSHGVTMSSVTLIPKVKQDMLYGYNGGLFFRLISEKYFGFQVELNYAMRGWKEAMENTPQYAYSRTMNYLEIPFLTHIYFGNKVRGFINLGPKIGMFISEKEKMNFDPQQITEINIKNQYHKSTQTKFDYGICGGAGVELCTKIGHFGVEGRYYYGLADFFKTGSTSDFGTASMQVISVNMTYAFSFHRKNKH